MKRKVVGIFVCMLVIATAIPAVESLENSAKDSAITPMESTKTFEDTYNSVGLANTLVSVDNPNRDDYTPKIVKNDAGTLVITYVKTFSVTTCPIVYSTNNGISWKKVFEIDSRTFNLPGHLQSPDITYIPNIDKFFFNSVDVAASIYNNVMYFLKGNIPSIDSYTAMSSTSSSNYKYAAAAHTSHWALSATTENYGSSLTQTLGLGYFSYGFSYPSGMGGYYYDGNKVYKSAPAAKLQMDENDNRIFLVAEQTTNGTIFIKSTVNNEVLLTNGEIYKNCEKYPDIEVWPGETISSGTDPDVSGTGNMVYVVYTEDGDVKCSYSSCKANTYEPGFSWQETTVATDAGFPAVYANGSTVKVAFVKNNDLYIVESVDGCASWSRYVKINSVDGYVVAAEKTIDLIKEGIVWTDVRNGYRDIYFSQMPVLPQDIAPDKPAIPVGQIEGKAGQEYYYTTSTIDPEGDQVYYLWDWGDGNTSGWLGPYDSGVNVTTAYNWTVKDSYSIIVKAKDDLYGKESAWSDPLIVTMPYSYNKPILQFLDSFFYRFSNAFPLLRQLMGY